MKIFSDYVEAVDPKTHQIKGTPLYDFLSFCKSNKRFAIFLDKIKQDPSKRILDFSIQGPTGALLFDWHGDRKDNQRLDIEFSNGRPLAGSQKERIYHFISKEIS